MKFEEQLASRLKHLPAAAASDADKADIRTEIERRATAIKRRRSRRLAPMTAVAAAVLIAFAVMYRLGVVPSRVLGSHGTFNIVVSPDTVTPTPLDTTAFRNSVKQYLERHSISSASTSSTSGAGSTNESATTAPPVINRISEMVVRWSGIDKGKYGYAMVTFVANQKPHIAELIALKQGSSDWLVEQVNVLPTFSAQAYSKFQIYPIEWSGSAILQGPVQYDFLSGLVINKSVTHILITPKHGPTVEVPVINGVYGYTQTTSSEASYNGPFMIQGVTGDGKVVYTHK